MWRKAALTKDSLPILDYVHSLCCRRSVASIPKVEQSSVISKKQAKRNKSQQQQQKQQPNVQHVKVKRKTTDMSPSSTTPKIRFSNNQGRLKPSIPTVQLNINKKTSNSDIETTKQPISEDVLRPSIVNRFIERESKKTTPFATDVPNGTSSSDHPKAPPSSQNAKPVNPADRHVDVVNIRFEPMVTHDMPVYTFNSDDQEYIATQAEFESMLRDFRSCDVIGLDTEFIQGTNYYPSLQVCQLASPTLKALFDMQHFSISHLVRISDELSKKECILHHAEGDLKIIHRLTNSLPARVFDTQVASNFVGMGMQRIGYGPMIEKLCNVTLPKTHSLSDWSLRPLQQEQVEYALMDVVYLHEARDRLIDILKEQGRLDWFHEEMETLSNPETYTEPDSQDAWASIPRISSLSQVQLAELRSLAAYRLNLAIARNEMPQRVIRNETLVGMITQVPSVVDDFYRVQGSPNDLIDEHGPMMLSLVLKAREEALASLAAKNSNDDALPKVLSHRAPPPPDIRPLMGLMRAWLDASSLSSGIASYLLASENEMRLCAEMSRDDLERCVGGKETTTLNGVDMRVLRGWRLEMFGRDLLAIRDGKKTAFMWSGDKLVS